MNKEIHKISVDDCYLSLEDYELIIKSILSEDNSWDFLQSATISEALIDELIAIDCLKLIKNQKNRQMFMILRSSIRTNVKLIR